MLLTKFTVAVLCWHSLPFPPPPPRAPSFSFLSSDWPPREHQMWVNTDSCLSFHPFLFLFRLRGWQVSPFMNLKLHLWASLQQFSSFIVPLTFSLCLTYLPRTCSLTCKMEAINTNFQHCYKHQVRSERTYINVNFYCKSHMSSRNFDL